MIPGSVRQADCLAAIRAHYAEHGRPPLLKEIAARLGVGVGRAWQLSRSLKALKLIAIEPIDARRHVLRLLNPLAELPTDGLQAELDERLRDGRA